MFKKLRIIILLGLIIFSFFNLKNPAKADTLDELQNRQADLDRQIQANQKALNDKKQQVKDAQSLITNLNSQIGATEQDINLSISKIDVTTQEIAKLQEQIDQKQKELDTQKQNLFETMRVMYETPQQSTVEIIVGSNSLSEIVDKAQYIESLQYQIENTMNTIKQLKAQLEDERNKLEIQKADLEKQKNALIEKKKGLDLQKTQKTQLLNQSLAEQTNFQTSLQSLMSERSQIMTEIYAQRSSQGGIFLGTSDYPFLAIDIPDPWSFLTRECTSYAAWYWNVKEGKNWYNTQPGRGSARYWDEIANTLHYTVSSSPRIGGFVVWRGPLFAGDQWGHVAIVEAVNPDGTINVSEMNWVRYSYSYRTGINPGNYGAYYYIY